MKAKKPQLTRPRKPRKIRKAKSVKIRRPRKPRIPRPKKLRVKRPPRKRPFALTSFYEERGFATVSDPSYGPWTYTNTRSVGNFGNNSVSRVIDPNWKVKVVKKQDATNPYSITKHEGKAVTLRGRCFTKLLGPPRMAESTGINIGAPVIPVASWTDASLQDLALKRLKAKINDHVGVFDAVVPIVELRELRKGIVSLIGSALDVEKRLRNYGRNVQRKAKHPNRKPTRYGGKTSRAAYADAWLQWSFGIKPIISDLEKANAAISTFLTKSDHIVHLKGGAMMERKIGVISPGSTGLYGASVTRFSDGIERLIYTYVGAFDLKIKSSNDYSAANVFGLDPSSILSTLYELTPYSWLIDYFTSLGDYLNDTFELPPGSTIFLSLTRVHTRDEVYTAKFVPSPGTYMASESMDRGYRSYKSINRSKLSAVPRLGLRIKTLDEVGKNGLNKLANLLSVLKSAHSATALRPKSYF